MTFCSFGAILRSDVELRFNLRHGGAEDYYLCAKEQRGWICSDDPPHGGNPPGVARYACTPLSGQEMQP